jgi:hypothetical protein
MQTVHSTAASRRVANQSTATTATAISTPAIPRAIGQA